eukprot:scaffold91359_cov44-Phaeocystis_antarctica.AAC.1
MSFSCQPAVRCYTRSASCATFLVSSTISTPTRAPSRCRIACSNFLYKPMDPLSPSPLLSAPSPSRSTWALAAAAAAAWAAVSLSAGLITLASIAAAPVADPASRVTTFRAPSESALRLAPAVGFLEQ